MLPRIFVPHLGFVENKLPDNIPPGLKEKIEELKSKSVDKEDFLSRAYEFLGSKYRTGRLSILTRFS